ncbi:MAG: FkbM family methyltransferase [Bacteroidales bacterium]
MLTWIYKFVFISFVNKLLSRMLKPFRRLLPERFHFPVCGFFRLRISPSEFIFMEGHYTSFITRKLFWNGIKGFEYNSVVIFVSLIKKSNVFFDIGANLGYYSLLAEKINPALNIFAFEPFSDAVTAFERNIKRNNFKKIQIIPVGLSDKTGEDTLFYRINDDFPEGLQLAGNNSMVNFKDNRNKQIQIKTQTLDSCVGELQIDALDLIKIDTETTEFIILSNGMKTIQTFRPVILCEVLPGNHEKKLETFFISLSYVFCRVEKGGVILLPKLEVVGDDENDFFFVPVEKIEIMDHFIMNKNK